MLATLIRLAFRNVTRNRRRTALAAAAVFFGVFSLVCIRGGLNGVQAAQRDAMVMRYTGAIQVHRKGYMAQVLGSPLSLVLDPTPALLARIRQVPHVSGVSARLVFGAMLNANDKTTMTLVTAYDPAAERAVCPRRFDELAGGNPVTHKGDILPSGNLARRLQWQTGAVGAVLAGDVDGVLNALEVTLSGTAGLPNALGVEQRTAQMHLLQADELLRTGGKVTELAVAVDDMRRVDAVATALRAMLGPDFEVHTWGDLAPQLVGEERNQEIVFGLFVFIFIVAALVGITNTLLVNMLERTREIGTMLAMGARRARILTLFVLEGVALGMVGCTAGVVAGTALVETLGVLGIHLSYVGGGVLHIYPFTKPPQAVALTLLCALGAVVASWVPARKASRLTPAQALSGLDS